MSRYSLALGAGPAEEIAKLAADAEAAGFGALWTSEMFHDPFSPLAAAATGTSRIGLGTSIALAFVRSPWVLALTALDLDAMSGGRFVLGLGTGLKRINERWHGVAYGKPTPHIREVVQLIRLITERAHGGEPIKFAGQFYTLDIQGWRRPQPPVRERIPIYLAGVREGMIRAAASVADGLLGHPIYSLRWTQDVVVPALARGLKEAGREREGFELCLGVCCAVDSDVRRARRAAAATIAFYATVKTYEPLFASFRNEVRAIQEALLKGDSSGAAEAVSDDMIDTFAATGDADQVRAQVKPYLDLADTVCLSPPDQLIEPAETERYRQALLQVFGE
ncbi:MAG: LLM class flavin-dependent oxidoreductase [Chloroflexi bacterium]|nr:LLM class flavin-dependent oxidoreductase [Chloroflexota bacterium]MCI0818634.1 LLM class flavin-dependent oxidoreductase [Chloroflexota bacterium]MCI0820293.1 LLM class flavin-dependent oxidoreductase [Chloroflexota bacterium]MCI0832539.1 LLM class flavin-dependent oxidoreductase [Chloroflexota bacterium]MCI0884543.1 LLM class flavin-dependent oxidoreductase [Chloroflexota bacterium]